MTNQEIFLSQWLRLKEEVVEKINKSISRGQIISFSELNKFYKGKLVRWEGYTRPEGRWLESQDNAQRENFLRNLHGVTLTEVKTNNNLGINPIIGTTLGAVVGVLIMILDSILRKENSFGLGIDILCIIVCAIIPTIILVKGRKEKSNKNAELVKKMYLKQIDETGEILAEFWR